MADNNSVLIDVDFKMIDENQIPARPKTPDPYDNNVKSKISEIFLTIILGTIMIIYCVCNFSFPTYILLHHSNELTSNNVAKASVDLILIIGCLDIVIFISSCLTRFCKRVGPIGIGETYSFYSLCIFFVAFIGQIMSFAEWQFFWSLGSVGQAFLISNILAIFLPLFLITVTIISMCCIRSDTGLIIIMAFLFLFS